MDGSTVYQDCDAQSAQQQENFACEIRNANYWSLLAILEGSRHSESECQSGLAYVALQVEVSPVPVLVEKPRLVDCNWHPVQVVIRPALSCLNLCACGAKKSPAAGMLSFLAYSILIILTHPSNISGFCLIGQEAFRVHNLSGHNLAPCLKWRQSMSGCLCAAYFLLMILTHGHCLPSCLKWTQSMSGCLCAAYSLLMTLTHGHCLPPCLQWPQSMSGCVCAAYFLLMILTHGHCLASFLTQIQCMSGNSKKGRSWGG